MQNFNIAATQHAGELATLLQKLDRPQNRAKLRKVLKEEVLVLIENLLYCRMDEWKRMD